jgi:hypothetical protein
MFVVDLFNSLLEAVNLFLRHQLSEVVSARHRRATPRAPSSARSSPKCRDDRDDLELIELDEDVGKVSWISSYAPTVSERRPLPEGDDPPHSRL